jgi:hypothetical protein
MPLTAVRALPRVSGLTPAEVARALPGDELVPAARVVMDRGLDLSAPPEQVWPWLIQLGKGRAGWYLPRWLEYLVPARRRAAREVRVELQSLQVGDTIPDYGPGEPTFRVELLDRPRAVVYSSRRQRRSGRPDMLVSWGLYLSAIPDGTRVHARLRIDEVGRRAPAVVATAGGLVDWLTIAGLAAGLRERVGQPRPRSRQNCSNS